MIDTVVVSFFASLNNCMSEFNNGVDSFNFPSSVEGKQSLKIWQCGSLQLDLSKLFTKFKAKAD